MKAKQWVDYPAEDCPNCGGNNSKVLTASKKDNYVHQDDEARCFDCQNTGYVDCCDDECADIIWDETETNPQ